MVAFSFLLLACLPMVSYSYPVGAPSVACGPGLNNQGATAVPPAIPITDTVYGTGVAGASYPASSGVGNPQITKAIPPYTIGLTHAGYPSKAQNITMTLTAAGSTKPVTIYTPGQTYTLTVTYTQPASAGGFGFEGFMAGAYTTGVPAASGGDVIMSATLPPVVAIDGTAITAGGQQMTCTGYGAHVTHAIATFLQAQNTNNGGKTLNLNWVAPMTDVGSVSVQAGFITGVPGDPYLGGMMTMTVMSPASALAAANANNNAAGTGGGLPTAVLGVNLTTAVLITTGIVAVLIVTCVLEVIIGFSCVTSRLRRNPNARV